MTFLATIRHTDIGADFLALPKYKERQAARAVLFDKEGRVALIAVTAKNYHKLPGGGIDEGESPAAALRREVTEETGCAIENFRELGTVEEYRNQSAIHQLSHGFAADVAGVQSAPDLVGYEVDHSFRLEWLSIEDAIRTIEETVPKDYDAKFIRLRDLIFLKEAQFHMNDHLKPAFDILAELEKAGFVYWVFGGVSIAAVAEHFFRKNRDIDLFVKEGDFDKAKLFLEQVCAKYDLEPHYSPPKRASDKPKLELTPTGRRRRGSHSDLLSVVPVYRDHSSIIFRYPKPEVYPVEMLKRIERRIGDYQCFTPPDQCIKIIFKNHMIARPDKRTHPYYIADAKHILSPEDFAELNWKI